MTGLKLKNAPIVEAVLDIDCDLPPNLDIAALEPVAAAAYRDSYSKSRKQLLHHVQLEAKDETPPKISSRQALKAIQFLSKDERQLLQFRPDGFSFNRLAPYTSLDDYILDIERGWKVFVELAKPIETRAVRLRYINRIFLPLEVDRVDLEEYLKIAPKGLDAGQLTLTGFMVQQSAVEGGTGHQVNLVLSSQAPEERLPVILDITAATSLRGAPSDWMPLANAISSLRRLKNAVFKATLTDKCLQLFQT